MGGRGDAGVNLATYTAVTRELADHFTACEDRAFPLGVSGTLPLWTTALADFLQKYAKDTTVATFNYDTILERILAEPKPGVVKAWPNVRIQWDHLYSATPCFRWRREGIPFGAGARCRHRNSSSSTAR